MKIMAIILMFSFSTACVNVNKTTLITQPETSISNKTILMGGNIQNVALNLSGKTTTFSGTSETITSPTSLLFASPGFIITDGKSYFLSDYNDGIKKINFSDKTSLSFSSNTFQHAAITSDSKNLYAVNWSMQSIDKIELENGHISTLAGSGVAGHTDGTGPEASFNYGSSITTDGINVYVGEADYIRKIEIATGLVTTFNLPTMDIYGMTTDGTSLFVVNNSGKMLKVEIASGNMVELYTSTDLNDAIATDGIYLYFAEFYTIKKMNIKTKVVSTIAGSTVGNVDGTGVTAKFNRLRSLVTDGKKLIAVDSNLTIRIIE